MTVKKFATDAGVEVPAITTQEMREIDRLAIEELGPNLFQMMENAGRNLALTAMGVLGPNWRRSNIVILAGSGGNGGGGICAARHLANRGAPVTVVVSSEDRLSPVPAEQLRIFRGTPGVVANVGALLRLEPDLVVDSVIGYSLGGPPHGPALEMIEWSRSRPTPVLSLDVPSGIDSTTGDAPGAHISASLTMTLALPKSGLDVDAVGELSLADIGIPGEVYRRAGLVVPDSVFGDRFRVPLAVP